MSGQGSIATFLKALFYKTCFCIGLGTVSYYSYGQVQKWTSPSFAPTVIESSTIQEKVDSLSAPSVNGSTTVTQAVHENPAQPSWSERHFAKFKTQVMPETKKTEAPLDPLVGAMAEASPSPSVSPSPGDTTAKKDETKDGEKKDGEKKEGEEKPEGELTAETPPAPVGPPAYPVSQEAPAPAQAAASPSAPNLSPDSPGGIPVANVAPSHSNYGSGASWGGSGSSTNSSASSILTTADISMLSSSIKAIFGDVSEDVNGQLCSVGATANSVTGCVPHSKYRIHTDRWSTAYGLLPDVSFSIASAAGSQIKVNLTLKVQDLSQNTQTINVSVDPSEILSHVETRSGTYYKVFDIKLPDTTVLGSDRLTGMTATLVYAENAAPAVGGSLTADSNFVFTRTKVQTTASAWEFTGQNRAPAANEQVMIADSIGYTINLQKSP